MKLKHYTLIGIFSLVIIFSGCTGKTYSYQIGHNTFTSSSNTRDNVFAEARETCEEINLKLKLVKEKVIKDDLFILEYKCLHINHSQYK